jgi:hypothetical protein
VQKKQVRVVSTAYRILRTAPLPFFSPPLQIFQPIWAVFVSYGHDGIRLAAAPKNFYFAMLRAFSGGMNSPELRRPHSDYICLLNWC